MSGKGTASGTDFESDAFAYVAVHILRELPLNWFGDERDVPVAVRTQSGTAGDDLFVTIRDRGTIDVQAKHGAKGNADFIEAAAKLIAGLHTDPELRGVILVDRTSTGTVQNEFAADASKYAEGVAVTPDTVMNKVLKELHARGIIFDPAALRRFRLIVRDLGVGMQAEETAMHQLTPMMADPAMVQDAWARLGKEGLRKAKAGGEVTRADLIELLRNFLPAAPAEPDRDTYLDWAIETNTTVLVAPLPDIVIDSLDAWDEMTPPAEVPTLTVPDAEAIRAYHAWDEKLSKYRVRDAYDSQQLLETRESRIILGGAGSGKSTLTHRLVREACEGGMLAMRVRLRQVSAAMRTGKSFEDAVVEQAFDGSGIPEEKAHALFARADWLIADGLDETEDRVEVARQLAAWLKGHPNAAVAVTTRPVGHAAGLLPGIRSVELTPMHNGAAMRAARAIFAAAGLRAERLDEAADRFEGELALNGAAAVAARTPLLLSCMVALALDGRPLPANRASLFHEVIDLLRRTPPVGRTPQVHDLDRHLAWRVVELVGWELAETPAVTRDDLINHIAGHLRTEGYGDAFTCSRDTGRALVFWEERRLFERLRSGSREYLTFVHRNLGEYAAARVVQSMNVEERRSWLLRVSGLPHWREVVLIAAAARLAEEFAMTLLEIPAGAPDHDIGRSLLAAACLEESETPSVTVVTLLLDVLGGQLGGERDIEVANAVMRFAYADGKRVAGAASRYLDHQSRTTRLAATAVVLAGEPAVLPAGFIEDFLEHLFERPKSEGGVLVIDPWDLTEGLHELKHHAAVLAIDALFRTFPADDAERVAKSFVEHHASTYILSSLHRIFEKHGVSHLAALVQQQQMRVYGSNPLFAGFDHHDELLAFLDAIAGCVGAPAPDTDASRSTLPLLSRVLSAARFWQVEFGTIADREDQESVELIFARIVQGLRIDRDALRRELASGYRIAEHLTGRGIFPHVRKVATEVDWLAAAAEPIPPDRLVRALLHSAEGVVWSAAELLAHGAAGPAAEQVVADALARGWSYTCFVVTQVAPSILPLDVAATAMRAALSRSDAPRALRGLFEGLKVGAAALRQALAADIIAATTHQNSYVATGAAEAMVELDHPCTSEFVSAIRTAFEYWANRARWCERCKQDVEKRFCPKCHIGVDSPRAALLEQLVRCDAVPGSELISLSKDEEHSVADIAKRRRQPAVR